MSNVIEKLAELVDEKGGKTYFVGGYVRDLFLGHKNKDIDVEVHGISEDTLKEILSKLGTPIEFGKTFGVYSLAGTSIDIALPRSEVKTGLGHKDFEITVDPFIGEEKAARRRDFTINALMKNVLTGEVLDFFNGKEDLMKRIIRHVDDNSFPEDPLRVFRAAQFAARFDFDVDEKTIELCKGIDTTVLSKERVFEELKKALLLSFKPSMFFDVLKKMNKFDYWFEEIKMIDGYEQNPNKHPEGDVYKHTMLSLDEAALYRDLVSDPINFMLLVLVHDFGKLRTKVMTEEGIHFYGHENSLDDATKFLYRLVPNSDTRHYILEMIPRHMRGHKIYSKNLDVYESNKWFDGVKHPKDLVYFSVADKANHPDYKRLSFLLDRYNLYEAIISKPQVTGEDLIHNGVGASENFSKYLDYARDLALRDVDKTKALELTLKYISEENFNE